MTIALAEAFAPNVRHDHDARQDQPVIDARNIEVVFKVEHGVVEAVKDVSFQLYRGETIAIVGESGSGKSVTARTVMGLLSRRATVSPRSSVAYDGQDILKLPESARRKLRGNRISMIFQEPMSSLNPIYTIGRGDQGASQGEPQAGLGAGAGTLAARSDPRAGGATQTIPAPALGRPAPARDDCHGFGQRSRRADRRRADNGARCHRAGADSQPDPQPAERVAHGGDPDHP